MQDLSQHKGSLTSALETLIGKMDSLSLADLKMEFLTVLASDDIKASVSTRAKWINITNESIDKNKLMRTISNIYLAGSNLSVI
jgi:hypothetical protein